MEVRRPNDGLSALAAADSGSYSVAPGHSGEGRDAWDAASMTQSMDGGAGVAVATSVRTVILVEGMSDRLALESLASRRGRDLRAEGVSIIAMGGAKNIGR